MVDVALHFDGGVRFPRENGFPWWPWSVSGREAPFVVDWVLDTLSHGNTVAVWSWRSRWPGARTLMKNYLFQLAAEHHRYTDLSGLRRWQRLDLHSVRTEIELENRKPEQTGQEYNDLAWNDSKLLASMLIDEIQWPPHLPMASRHIDHTVLKINGGYVGIDPRDFKGVEE